MLKKIFISCDQATAICNKNQYKEASLLDKLRLKIHLLQCKMCGLYSKQNTLLTKLFKLHASACAKQSHRLTSEDKELLKKNIKRHTMN